MFDFCILSFACWDFSVELKDKVTTVQNYTYNTELKYQTLFMGTIGKAYKWNTFKKLILNGSHVWH